MSTGRSDGDGRRARKAVKVGGLVDAIDWLEANEPRRADIWDRLGRDKRRRTGALLDAVRDLARADRDLWPDIERAIRELTEDLHRRIESGDGND